MRWRRSARDAGESAVRAEGDFSGWVIGRLSEGCYENKSSTKWGAGSDFLHHRRYNPRRMVNSMLGGTANYGVGARRTGGHLRGAPAPRPRPEAHSGPMVSSIRTGNLVLPNREFFRSNSGAFAREQERCAPMSHMRSSGAGRSGGRPSAAAAAEATNARAMDTAPAGRRRGAPAPRKEPEGRRERPAQSKEQGTPQ